MRALRFNAMVVVATTMSCTGATNTGDAAPQGPRRDVVGGVINRANSGYLGLAIAIRHDESPGTTAEVTLHPPDGGPLQAQVRLDELGIGWADLVEVAPVVGTWSALVEGQDAGFQTSFVVTREQAEQVLPMPQLANADGGVAVTGAPTNASFACQFMDIDGRTKTWTANCDGLCTTVTPGTYWLRMWMYTPSRLGCGESTKTTWSAPSASYADALAAVSSTAKALGLAVGGIYEDGETSAFTSMVWLNDAGADGASRMWLLGDGRPELLRPWFQQGRALVEADQPLRAGNYWGVIETDTEIAHGAFVALTGDIPGDVDATVMPQADGSLVVQVSPGDNTAGYVVQVYGFGEPLPTVVTDVPAAVFPAGTLQPGSTYAVVVLASNQGLSESAVIPTSGWSVRRHVVLNVRMPGA